MTDEITDANSLETLPEDWESALAVVAHPDDLEYGTASAIARWTSQGKLVSYLLLTRGEAGIDSMHPDQAAPLREAEERSSASVVGVDTVEFLDYQDGTIEYGLPLRRDIARAVRKHRPQVLLTLNYHLTWGPPVLNMADHRWVGLAVLDAARDAGNRWIFPELLDEGLEPWGGVRMACFNGSPYPTHGVDVTSYFQKGIDSLDKHRVYLENLPDGGNTKTFLRTMATESGKLLGCELTVSLEVIWL